MSYGANDPNGLPLGLPSILSLGLPPLVNPYPALNLDFINNQTLDSRVTFSRGSQATLFDSTGTLRYAANNIVSYSEQFDNAFWSKTDVTVTQNAAIAPDGTLTADKLIVNNGTTGSNLNISPTFQSSTAYTGSIYAKAGEWNWLEIELRSETTSILRAWFDLSNGVVGTVNAGMTATITPVGNGWYRCTATRTTAATNTSTRLRYYSTNADNSNTTGDGTSGIFIWGAMLNIGSTAGAYVQTVASAYYAPRFYYNPSTLEPLGLLIEEARTNLFLQSQFAASWISFGTATQTINNAVAPDGTTTANLVSSPAATDYVYQAPTTVIGTSYAFSFFVKNSTATISHYQVRTSSTAAFGTLTWSGATLTAVTPTIGTASFVDVGNGWYRVIAIYTATETAARHRIGGGDNTSTTGNILVWGAQVEAGAFATSYIPTTTTALTRNADLASMTGTNFSSWYNASEGTLFGQFLRTASTNSQQGRVFSLSNSSNTALIEVYQTSGTNPAAQITNTSVQAQWTPTGFTVGISVKEILAYKLNDSNASFNGSAETPDTVCTIPSVTQANIGNRQDLIRALNGYVQRLSYYPTRLPDSTLQALTA
jgi:hypothetical protein